MNIVKRITGLTTTRKLKSAVENTITADQLAELFRESYRTNAGPAVNQTTAWRSSAVFACVRIILAGMTTLPVMIYDESNPKDRKPLPNHWAMPLLNLQPNPRQSASTFWSCLIADKLLGGNGMAHIERLGTGRATGFTWIPRIKCQPRLNKQFLRLWYYYTDDADQYRVVDQDDIIHVPNIGWDGEGGMSSIKAGAQGIGLGLAAEEHSARVFTNSARMDYVLKFPNKLSDDQAQLIVDTILKKHQGPEFAHLPGVITEGGEVQQLTMNAKDSQLLEARQFSIEDIARFFGVPPVMIGSMQKSSSWGAGVAQQAAWLVMFNLQAQAESLEQEFNRKLFLRTYERMRFNFTGLLRGDIEARFQAYDIARGGQDKPGLASRNELRAMEGWGPIPGGDEIYDPSKRSEGNEG